MTKEVFFSFLIAQTLLFVIVLLWGFNTDTHRKMGCVARGRHFGLENRKIVHEQEMRDGYDMINVMAVRGDPELASTLDKAAITSEDDIHIRSCFYQDGQITCLIDIRKSIIGLEFNIQCPDNVYGEVIGIKHNEYRGKNLPYLANHFAKVICPCKNILCTNYEREIQNHVFSLTQVNTKQKWIGSLATHNKPATYKYTFCSVSGILRHKPVGIDIWLKHHWESGVEHVYVRC